ncbi:hypothetical protein I3J27_37975 [Bradyrhizobium xenonodulans]|uniref:Uncharacterized protein n=1 Tax=Bradyrhizobium xenonodulans TaxID=2736875 RepID=A0ABY7MKG6_9BRAD|nr:hypothetical protein [Bradyrhizobium xenonodulans]WBL78659.1 hypothetical protein I3J27_37975 [Bradyrhizobium xenonodulans]
MLSKIDAPDGINSMLRSTLAVEMPGCVGFQAVVSSRNGQIKKVPAIKDIRGER